MVLDRPLQRQVVRKGSVGGELSGGDKTVLSHFRPPSLGQLGSHPPHCASYTNFSIRPLILLSSAVLIVIPLNFQSSFVCNFFSNKISYYSRAVTLPPVLPVRCRFALHCDTTRHVQKVSVLVLSQLLYKWCHEFKMTVLPCMTIRGAEDLQL
ncbi:hypothetical protein J6590_087365 [Homalodisca vitripennis]|nr:hypothetical protein J6590_087365 [Homalodisca vitripennis]